MQFLVLCTTAMKYRLKQRAVKLCMQTQEEYAKCCSDKVFSVVWACRKQLQAFSDCCHAQYVGSVLVLQPPLCRCTHVCTMCAIIHHSTNDQVLDRLKQRWLAAGSPSTVDWDTLLDGVS